MTRWQNPRTWWAAHSAAASAPRAIAAIASAASSAWRAVNENSNAPASGRCTIGGSQPRPAAVATITATTTAPKAVSATSVDTIVVTDALPSSRRMASTRTTSPPRKGVMTFPPTPARYARSVEPIGTRRPGNAAARMPRHTPARTNRLARCSRRASVSGRRWVSPKRSPHAAAAAPSWDSES